MSGQFPADRPHDLAPYYPAPPAYPPLLPPPNRPRRRPVAALVVGGGAAIAVVVVVLILVVHAVSSPSSSQNDLTALRQLVGSLPLPSGTVQTDERATEGHADVTTTLIRDYRLPSAGASTADLKASLDAAHWEAVNPQTGDGDPSRWSAASAATQGDIYVRPPNTTGDGVELNWDGASLTVSVQPGQVQQA